MELDFDPSAIPGLGPSPQHSLQATSPSRKGPHRAGRGLQGPTVPLFLRSKETEAGEGESLARGRTAPGPESLASRPGEPCTVVQAVRGPGAGGCGAGRGRDPRRAGPGQRHGQQASALPHGPPDTLMGIPPKRDHLIDFQGPGPTGTSWASLQGAVLHLGQEVFGEGAAHIAAVAILWRAKEVGAGGARWIPSALGTARHRAQTAP